jgi:hypothetical protein
MRRQEKVAHALFRDPIGDLGTAFGADPGFAFAGRGESEVISSGCPPDKSVCQARKVVLTDKSRLRSGGINVFMRFSNQNKWVPSVDKKHLGIAVSTSLFVPLEVVLLLTARCIDVPERPSQNQNVESVYS